MLLVAAFIGGFGTGALLAQADDVPKDAETTTDPEIVACPPGPAGIEFVLIPAGTFVMGWEDGDDEESPRREVRISRPFCLCTFEVTQGQWKAVMGNNPSRFADCGDDCPVEMVTWEMAQEFLQTINEKEGTTAYRLPTEAEWEYACRTGTRTDVSSGVDAELLGQHAWWRPNADERTHAVGTKKPNAWGLFDMQGNVWEWAWDEAGASLSEPGRNARRDTPAGFRVLRGGGWDSGRSDCFHYATRVYHNPVYNIDDVGFRVVRTPQ